jgi:hypothetical protein
LEVLKILKSLEHFYKKKEFPTFKKFSDFEGFIFVSFVKYLKVDINYDALLELLPK